MFHFSESRDLLSQWRAYANESGIALAFNPDELTEIAEINKLKLYQCAYSDSDQFAIVDDKITETIDAFRARIMATDYELVTTVFNTNPYEVKSFFSNDYLDPSLKN